MEKRNRKLSVLLALAVCVVMLFSAVYIAEEAGHNCIGENCPICCQISICSHALKLLGYGVAAIVAAVALAFSAAVFSVCSKTNFRESTPITLKVKLSD